MLSLEKYKNSIIISIILGYISIYYLDYYNNILFKNDSILMYLFNISFMLFLTLPCIYLYKKSLKRKSLYMYYILYFIIFLCNFKMKIDFISILLIFISIFEIISFISKKNNKTSLINFIILIVSLILLILLNEHNIYIIISILFFLILNITYKYVKKISILLFLFNTLLLIIIRNINFNFNDFLFVLLFLLPYLLVKSKKDFVSIIYKKLVKLKLFGKYQNYFQYNYYMFLYKFRKPIDKYNNKNILFIIGSLRSGGAERVITNLCNNLKDKYNVTLVVGNLSEADYIPDVEIIEMNELSKTKNIKLGIKKLRNLKKEKEISLSISFLIYNDFLNILSSYKERKIVSIRNYMTLEIDLIKDYKNKKLYKKILKFNLKYADKIVNVGKDMERDNCKNFNSDLVKNIVIPNYCELELINKKKKERLDKNIEKIFNGKVIINAGRYSFQKGQWHLIRSFKEVVKKVPDARLVLIGRGELREYLEKLVYELKLKNNVFILDYDVNVYKYMDRSNIFILNSFYEGMPNVVLEAMACDLPVIGTNTFGDTKEILSDSNVEIEDNLYEAKYGILIPPCDRIMYSSKDKLTKEEKIMKDAILLLLNDKKKLNHYKKMSKERLKDFKKEDILNKWITVIEEELNK